MNGDSGQLKGVRALYEFSRRLLSEDVPDNALQRLVEATRHITDADEVILLKVEGDSQRVVAVANDGHDGPAGDDEPQYSETLIAEVIEKNSPVLLQDVCDNPRFQDAQSVQVLSITSAMGAPLYHQGELLGIIYMARQRLTENFSESHRDLMTVVASQAGLLLGRLASTQAHRETEARYRSLVEMSPLAILVLDGDRVAFANQMACELWEVESPTALNGKQIGYLFDPWRSQSLMHSVGSNEPFQSLDAWIWRSEPETSVSVEVAGRPVESNDGPQLQLMITKVGTKKSVLAHRARTDRLTVMGTMAATVGHEINNPLSYVYANLDFVVEELEDGWGDEREDKLPGQTRREILNGLYSAREGTERIRNVVDSIQSFIRLDDDQRSSTMISEALESSLRIARNKLDPGVELQVDIRPTAPVPVSAAQLGQVFLNLLVNGAQALDEVANEDDRERRLEVRSRQDGEQVIVEIADTGPGIRADVRDRMFDPFVSTKPGDRGTGLGLAICQDIINASGGRIEVESQSGKGSLFRVCLPAAEELATESLEMIPDGDHTASACVLIVDPEPTLAMSLRRILQGQHEVTVAQTMGDAVELLGQERHFDVILCDLRFRGGMGRDFFRWVEKNAPDYWEKMLAMTGKPSTQEDEKYLQELPNPWLSKPFDLRRLRALIASMIDEKDQDTEVG